MHVVNITKKRFDVFANGGGCTETFIWRFIRQVVCDYKIVKDIWCMFSSCSLGILLMSQNIELF